MSLDLLCDTSKNKTTIVEMRISIFNLTEAFEMIDLFLNCNVQYMEVKYFNLGLQVLCVCARACVCIHMGLGLGDYFLTVYCSRCAWAIII